MSTISADSIVPRYADSVEIKNLKPAGGNSAIVNVDVYTWNSLLGGAVTNDSSTTAYGTLNVVNNVVTFTMNGFIFTPSVATDAGESLLFASGLPDAVFANVISASVPVVVQSNVAPQLAYLEVSNRGNITLYSAEIPDTRFGFHTGYGAVIVPTTTLQWVRGLQPT